MKARYLPLLAAVLGFGFGFGFGVWAPPAAAGGTNLDGRLAPDMTFPAGLNGVEAGLSLSRLKGRPVWVKFILRDCPRCQRELPRAQQLHEKWGGSGLVVLIVMHELGPDSMRTWMEKYGFTFPLATDPRGDFARRYGVRHRPADYIIGIDGRVQASNAAPDKVILTELGRYRLARLGSVPAEVASVRDSVWRWDYGAALRTAEAAARKEGAAEEVRIFAARVKSLAQEELRARVAYAGILARRRQATEARALYDRLVPHFADTSLAGEAEEARRAFVTNSGGR
jgi:peroxiredoxin